ncbi:hypothetical protein AVEN_108995-1, partial [Araneus ventricosus]
GRCGLVISSRLRGWRVPRSKPYSTPYIRPVWGLLYVESPVVTKCPPAGVVRKFGEWGASPGVVLVI